MKISNNYYYVYILTNVIRSVLYIGVTNNLERRLTEHYFASTDKIPDSFKGTSFTGKYNCHILVYFESYQSIKNAIAREKELKKWHRKWKDELISRFNPTWRSLNLEFSDTWPPRRE